MTIGMLRHASMTTMAQSGSLRLRMARARIKLILGFAERAMECSTGHTIHRMFVRSCMVLIRVPSVPSSVRCFMRSSRCGAA
eukprot:11546715-Alexandrium_andersonii.AAC.1